MYLKCDTADCKGTAKLDQGLLVQYMQIPKRLIYCPNPLLADSITCKFIQPQLTNMSHSCYCEMVVQNSRQVTGSYINYPTSSQSLIADGATESARLENDEPNSRAGKATGPMAKSCLSWLWLFAMGASGGHASRARG